MNKKILIIIPVYNGVADFLGDCFSSLRNINYPKADLEILAIDDVSRDGSAEFIKTNYPEIKIIVNPKNFGFAKSNNVGLQYALDRGFDYVYLLNQDTVAEPDFLAQAVEVMAGDNQIGAVQSKLLLHQNQKKINSLGNEIHYLGFAFAGGHMSLDREMNIREIAYPSGAAVLLRCQALREVGLFNPDFFMYHEDADLGWRLWLGGWKVMLAPKSVVYHKYEFSRSISKFFYMERNRYLVMLQNYKIATLLLILPAATLMDLAMFFYSFISGWWRQELGVYAYFFKFKNWHEIIKTRAVIQQKRKVKDKEIIKRFSGVIDFQDIQNPLLKYIANPFFNLYWQVVKKFIWW